MGNADKFNCQDCEKFANCPPLRDWIWKELASNPEYNPNPRFLCFACAEKRLQREINFADLKDCSANEPFLTMIDRLTDRIDDAVKSATEN